MQGPHILFVTLLDIKAETSNFSENTHEMKRLAKELPHPIQRYLLPELGNAYTTVLPERDTFMTI